MINKELVIGILGGMGTFATINLFRQYAEVFPAEKEWERPRIIIDNRCTMPSRVRALIYHEDVEMLINEMVDSIQHLIMAGGEKIRIILACNTSHLFLPMIYERIPYAEKNIVNIIDGCVDQIVNNGISKVNLLGTEATIDSNVYQDKLNTYGVKCVSPSAELYPMIRECIEAVKTNTYNERVKRIFCDLVSSDTPVILGCTELPILYDIYCKDVPNITVYDPLKLALQRLRREYDNA